MAAAVLYMIVGALAASAPSPHARALALVGNMSLDEKLSMLAGHDPRAAFGLAGYTGIVPGTPRLGIPPLHMNDGPQGFRASGLGKGSSTCWPSGLTVAATWDVATAASWGLAIGEEFRGKGANVALGPGLNVARVPWNGRTFEYLSGEDPALGAALGAAAIRGIQSAGVIANAKHFIFNNQEFDRGLIPLPHQGYSAVVDERTKHEVYLPPFEAAVRAGVGSVMCVTTLSKRSAQTHAPSTLMRSDCRP